jgi:hypothetical protein
MAVIGNDQRWGKPVQQKSYCIKLGFAWGGVAVMGANMRLIDRRIAARSGLLVWAIV